jgi:hypothetical protein
MKKLKLAFLIRISLLRVEPIIPSTPNLQKLEALDTRITCLIPINHPSLLCCLGKHIYDGLRVPFKMPVTIVARSLCEVTSGQHPSGLSAAIPLRLCTGVVAAVAAGNGSSGMTRSSSGGTSCVGGSFCFDFSSTDVSLPVLIFALRLPVLFNPGIPHRDHTITKMDDSKSSLILAARFYRGPLGLPQRWRYTDLNGTSSVGPEPSRAPPQRRC